MSLKGYEFYNQENETEAMFLFKRLYLYIYKPLAEDRLQEIKKYIQEKGYSIHKIVKAYE